MSMKYYGVHVIPVSTVVVESICGEEIEALRAYYEQIDNHYLNERNLEYEDFQDEIRAELADCGPYEDTEQNKLFAQQVVDAWEQLGQTFKRKTGLSLSFLYYTEDDNESDYHFEEGVNFCVRFEDVFKKTNEALFFESLHNEQLALESFVTWG